MSCLFREQSKLLSLGAGDDLGTVAFDCLLREQSKRLSLGAGDDLGTVAFGHLSFYYLHKITIGVLSFRFIILSRQLPRCGTITFIVTKCRATVPQLDKYYERGVFGITFTRYAHSFQKYFVSLTACFVCQLCAILVFIIQFDDLITKRSILLSSK